MMIFISASMHSSFCYAISSTSVNVGSKEKFMSMTKDYDVLRFKSKDIR